MVLLYSPEVIRVLVAACLLTTTSAWPLAQRATSKTPVTKTSTAATCSADLGAGVKTRRKFCDAVVARDASSGIVIAIPPHRGTAVLRFDLHARFAVPAADAQPGSAFARHLAVVAVVRASGAVIGRGAVVSELRGRSDLYDQIAGGGGATA